MTEKRSVMLLASAAVLTLALQQNAVSAPTTEAPASAKAEQAAQAGPAAAPAAGKASQQQPAPAAQKAPAAAAPAPSGQPAAAKPPAPTPPAAPTATPGGPVASPPQPANARERMEQRRAQVAEERSRRYEEMRARAAKHGLDFPQEPPWRKGAGPGSESPVPPASGAQWSDMSPEESAAKREERYRQMRDRAMKRLEENRARWESYWKILDEMTPEQKEAIEAVFGRAHRRLSPRAMGPQMRPGMPMQPPFAQPEYGYPSGAAFPGYGIPGTEPSLYDRGPASSSYDPQPMPPGAARPPQGAEKGNTQAPPPPGGDDTQP